MAEMNQIPPLQNLPVELLLDIFDYLDRDTVIRLRCVCRRLYDVVAPELYRHPRIEDDQGDSFAACLDKSPELARHVRSLTVHYHQGVISGRDKINSLTQLRHCRPQLPDLPVAPSGNPQYAESLSTRLAHMDGLEKLVIRAHAYEDAYEDLAIARNQEVSTHITKTQQLEECAKFHTLFLQSVSSPILINLQTCELNLSNGESWDLGLRDSIFLHPHLKSLSIYAATMKDFCCFNENRRHTTSLEELTLRGCDIGTEALGKVLAVPRALRRFTFKGTIRQIPLRAKEARQHYVDTIAQNQGHSLLALDLEFPLLTPMPRRRYHTDFLSFSVLQELATTVEVLEGNLCRWVSPLTIHLFPQSLKHLRIMDDRDTHKSTVSPGLYAEAAHKWLVDDTLPNVRTVTFITRENVSYVVRPIPEGSDIVFPNTDVVFRRQYVQPQDPFPDIECLCCESWTICGNSYGL